MTSGRRPLGCLAIDAFGLEEGSRQRGIGAYIRHLLDGLSARDDLDLRVIGGLPADAPAGAGQVTLPMWAPGRWGAQERHWRLPAAIARSGADIFHSTGYVPPRRSPVPWVQTLQDLTPIYFEHPMLAGQARRWRSFRGSLQTAAAIITPSRSSADQGVRFLGLDARRMHVVSYGVDPIFSPNGGVVRRDRPYLLWVSAWGPHKGSQEAIEAIRILRDSGYDHQLVLAGEIRPGPYRQIKAHLDATGMSDTVELAGHVADLPALYRGATAVVVSSRAEGFGFPPLEAMACGVPVVSFDNTSLPEVVGDAGLLVADGDVEALARALREVIDDSATQKDLAARGIARAAQYTWARSIDQHVEVYREVGLAS